MFFFFFFLKKDFLKKQRSWEFKNNTTLNLVNKKISISFKKTKQTSKSRFELFKNVCVCLITMGYILRIGFQIN